MLALSADACHTAVMRSRGLLLLAGAAAGLVALSGCSGNPAPGGASTASPGEFPRPAAADEVLAQGTVLQKDGEEPQLCLGAVAESYPPLCGGPPILGWDWASAAQAESASGVTWGSYAITGTWDATAFTATQPPVPLSLYDPLARFDPRLDPANSGASDASTLSRLHDQLNAADYNPGTFADWSESPILSSWTGNGYLWVSVIYEDGSVQKFFDEQFGPGVVAVQSALQAGGAAPGTAPGTPTELPQPTSSAEVTGQAMILQEDGQPPKACFGGIAASLPPQCGGPVVSGWDWADVEESESASGVTWGTYAVTGTWQGGVFTVTRPAFPVTRADHYARQDPRLVDEDNPGTTDQAELEGRQEDLNAYFPNGTTDWSTITLLGAGIQNGYLAIDVIYDDGSVQQFFDDQWGEGVAVVQSALRPVD
jgi:hypothetical protein